MRRDERSSKDAEGVPTKAPQAPGSEADSPGVGPVAEGMLALQRGAGNQAVSRALLHRQSGPTQEFVPEMSVKPDAQEALIGQTFRERLEVLNWREAPRGTFYSWGGGPDSSAAMRHIGISDATAHGTSTLQAAPLRPGTSSVQANLVHQVPGGPERTWMGPHIPVTTPVPEMELEMVSGPPARGGVVQYDRLAVGDRLAVRARVSNVDRRIQALESPGWASHMTTGVLEVVDEHDVDPLTHEWVIEAKKAGEYDFGFYWQVPNTDMEPLETLDMSGSVEMDRALFSRRCASAHQLVDGQYDLIAAYTKDLARLYGQAWRRHTGALQGANARRKLIADLIVSGALAFVTGGAGGVIGKWVSSRFDKDALEGAFMGDAVKDLFKDTTRRLGRAGLEPPGLAAFEAFPEDPSDWQNVEEAKILREAGNIKLLISAWSRGADESREFLTDFDPVEDVETRMKVAGHTPADLGTPDAKETFRQEKGFWMEWLSNYGHELHLVPVGYLQMEWDVDSNLDKPIKERVQACATELGESGDVWLAQWAEPLRQRLETEAERRNEEHDKQRGY